MAKNGIAIETERLLLRNWERRDREPLARLNADERVMEFMPARLSRAESDDYVDRIEDHFREHGFGVYALELRREREFVGYTGLAVPGFDAHFTPCVEIGWRLAAEHWGRGLATEAAAAALAHGFDELALEEVVAMAVPANRR